MNEDRKEALNALTGTRATFAGADEAISSKYSTGSVSDAAPEPVSLEVTAER
jgi:hypothetical protein